VNARAKRALPVVALVLPGGAALVGGFALWRYFRRRAMTRDLTARLVAGLDTYGQLYAAELAAAAVATCPGGVDLDRWAFTFAGVISRESNFGAFLSPRGPNGLGDYGHGHGLGQVDDRWNDDEPEWSQKRMDHLASGDWTDPERHLLFCAQLLAHCFDELGAENLDGDERLRAAAASYNAGVPAVSAAIANGGDFDRVTTQHNYGADVLRRATNYQQRAAA
jgi:hypothetical protein